MLASRGEPRSHTSLSTNALLPSETWTWEGREGEEGEGRRDAFKPPARARAAPELPSEQGHVGANQCPARTPSGMRTSNWT